MASTQPFNKIILKPDDVPGAKLNVDDFENYGNVQLKRWLECRGLKTGGNKSDLVQRCKDAVKAGKEDEIDISVDGGKWCSTQDDRSSLSNQESIILPLFGWKPFPSRQIPINFNYGHIYHYLLESVVLKGDSGQTEDTDLSHMTSKPLTKGDQYVKSKSVNEIMDVERNNLYFVKAKVTASMRNEERTVHVTLSRLSGAVRDASCTCPGSALGRCNHVAALLLTIDKHCKDVGHEPIACTSKQCEWGKGQKKKKNPNKITEAAYSSYKPKEMKLTEFDPRPTEFRQANDSYLNNFASNLKYDALTSGKTSMWQTLLDFKHVDYDISSERRGILKAHVWHFFNNLKEECESHDQDVFMIPNTESQTESIQWKSSRWFRITASTAKKADSLGNLLQSPPTDATLRKCQSYIGSTVWQLENYTFSSPDMLYGIENEDKAREDYLYKSHMEILVPDIRVEKTGFWVSKMWPELGCSPDGLVTDPTESHKHGLLEIKCLKIFRNLAPNELFKSIENKIISKKDLYSACFKIPTSENAPIELKKTNMYYYQIQFQLAVMGLKWCDFVLWSPVGTPSIERIRRDDKFIVDMIGNVTLLWHQVIAPERFEMRVPRKLKPIVLD